MTQIRIRGHSDDIIVCEGGLTDEFYPSSDKPGYLAFSDGTVIEGRYDDTGCWRFNRICHGMAAYTKIEATDPDENYADHVHLDGDIRWVVFGERLERIKSS